MMLDALDSINWKNLRHSHGTAEEFPQWLRKLASDDDAAWDRRTASAYTEISELSNHQGSIYEVTPIVASFLIELLQHLPHRAELIIALLSGYARGHVTFRDLQTGKLSSNYGRRPEDLESPVEDVRWVARTRQILQQHLELFIPYLDSPDPGIRAVTVILLNPFRDDPDVAELFTRRAQIETDQNVIDMFEYSATDPDEV